MRGETTPAQSGSGHPGKRQKGIYYRLYLLQYKDQEKMAREIST